MKKKRKPLYLHFKYLFHFTFHFLHFIIMFTFFFFHLCQRIPMKKYYSLREYTITKNTTCTHAKVNGPLKKDTQGFFFFQKKKIQ